MTKRAFVLPPAPLLVRSFGRTGTTLVMQLLGTSPNVLFAREYPFETRLLAYAVRLAEVVGAPTQNDDSWNEHTIMCADPRRVGPIPYASVPAKDREKIRRRIESMRDDFYQTQYRLLSGRGLADTVVERLKLYENPEFVGRRVSPVSCP